MCNRLVKRPEDAAKVVMDEITFYKENVLPPLEDFMAEHDRQMMIELDANMSEGDLYKVSVHVWVSVWNV